jgi:hypothetical protein
VKGSELPAARVVSNKIQNSQAEKSVDLTHMFTQWGQFIIHDIVHTPVVKGKLIIKLGGESYHLVVHFSIYKWLSKTKFAK